MWHKYINKCYSHKIVIKYRQNMISNFANKDRYLQKLETDAYNNSLKFLKLPTVLWISKRGTFLRRVAITLLATEITNS